MTCPPPFGRKCLRRATPRKNRRGTRSCRPSRCLPSWLARNEIFRGVYSWAGRDRHPPSGAVNSSMPRGVTNSAGAFPVRPNSAEGLGENASFATMGDRSVVRLGGRGRRPRGIGGERVGALGRRFQWHGPATFPGIRQSARQYRHLALFDRNRDGDGACGGARRQRGRDGEGARPKASRRRDQRGQRGRAGEPQWRVARILPAARRQRAHVNQAGQCHLGTLHRRAAGEVRGRDLSGRRPRNGKRVGQGEDQRKDRLDPRPARRDDDARPPRRDLLQGAMAGNVRRRRHAGRGISPRRRRGPGAHDAPARRLRLGDTAGVPGHSSAL